MTASAEIARCDRHVGEAYPPRCADCSAAAESEEHTPKPSPPRTRHGAPQLEVQRGDVEKWRYFARLHESNAKTRLTALISALVSLEAGQIPEAIETIDAELHPGFRGKTSTPTNQAKDPR